MKPEALRSLYLEEARRVGAQVGALMDAVGPAWWFVTSPHGLSLAEVEGPGPRARRTHLERLAYELVLDRTTRVPLMVFAPGQATPREVSEVVELVDLAPTLAAQAGGQPPAGPGDDLLALAGGGRAYTEFGDMLTLRDGDHTLSFRCYRPNSSSLEPELTACLERALQAQTRRADGSTHQGSIYLNDVRRDPAQREDLAPAQPERARELAEAILSIRRGDGAPPGGRHSPELLEELKEESVGYW